MDLFISIHGDIECCITQKKSFWFVIFTVKMFYLQSPMSLIRLVM